MKIQTIKGDPILNMEKSISAGQERDFAIRYCPIEETHWSCNLDHHEIEIIDIPNKRIFEDFVRYWGVKAFSKLKEIGFSFHEETLGRDEIYEQVKQLVSSLEEWDIDYIANSLREGNNRGLISKVKTKHS